MPEKKRLLPEQLTAAIPFMLEINPIIALDAFFGKPRTVDGTGERKTVAICSARPWQAAFRERKRGKENSVRLFRDGSLLCPFALSISFSEKTAGAARG